MPLFPREAHLGQSADWRVGVGTVRKFYTIYLFHLSWIGLRFIILEANIRNIFKHTVHIFGSVVMVVARVICLCFIFSQLGLNLNSGKLTGFLTIFVKQIF